MTADAPPYNPQGMPQWIQFACGGIPFETLTVRLGSFTTSRDLDPQTLTVRLGSFTTSRDLDPQTLTVQGDPVAGGLDVFHALEGNGYDLIAMALDSHGRAVLSVWSNLKPIRQFGDKGGIGWTFEVGRRSNARRWAEICGVDIEHRYHVFPPENVGG